MKNLRTSKLLFLFIMVLITLLAKPLFTATNARRFTDSFMLDSCSFSSTGRNPYFILEPGFEATFEGKEDGENVRNVITVLNETRVIDGIETRVVRERETHNGELVEISKNFFAICKRTNSVFYFGEITNIYENGMIVSHEGSWQQGVNGARGGLLMPGIILLGSRFQQEIAPEVALDRAEIVQMNLTLSTPAGIFENCIRTRETTPLEPDALEFKVYAPGIGLVQDDTLKIVSYSIQ
jgi:hypothetical protein